MSSRTKVFAIVLMAGVAISSLVGFLLRKEIVLSLRAYYLGRVMVAGEQLGLHLGPVDEIEILALGGQGNAGSPDTFYGDLGYQVGVVNRRTVKGTDVDRILDIWRYLPVGHQYRSLCFHPHYALRFRHAKAELFETALCWECSVYTLPVGPFGTFEYGFDATSPNGIELLTLLSELAPHPKDLGDYTAPHKYNKDEQSAARSTTGAGDAPSIRSSRLSALLWCREL